MLQQPAMRGSQKWLQRLVSDDPGVLCPPDLPHLAWLSPRADDAFSEYRDGSALARLGLAHLAGAEHALGLSPRHPLRQAIHHVYPDVSGL